MLVALLMALAAASAVQPGPELTPEQVVRIQLDALKKNDSGDSGIRVVFLFASPANRAGTGPIERFIAMVKNPVYRPMLNYRSHEAAPVSIRGDEARQKVTLTDRAGRRATYLFLLSRQKEKPYSGCWMTDSVIRIEEGPDSNRIARGIDGRHTPVAAQRVPRRAG